MKTLVIVLVFINSFILPQNKLLEINLEKGLFKVDYLVKAEIPSDEPGAAVMVIYNGVPELMKGYGKANIVTGEDIDINTNFYLASISKQFTAAAIAVLVSNGKLKYEDKVSKYIHDFPNYGSEITIHHLLSHTSGLPDHFSLLGYPQKDISGLTNRMVLELLKQQDSLNFKPGEKYSYCNSGYVIASMIVEIISGQSFNEFVNQNVFYVAGMNNSFLMDKEYPRVNRAIGYTKDSNNVIIENDYKLFTTGAGGVYSSLLDFYFWDQALYKDDFKKYIRLDDATQSKQLNDGTFTDYGYGWIIGEYENSVKKVQYFSHTGALYGFRNLYVRIPELNFSVLILSNRGKPLIEVKDLLEFFF